MIRMLTTLAIAAFVSCGAAAQSAVHYKEGQRVDPYDVARILHTAPIKTRSIRLLDGDAPKAAANAGPSSLSLPVRFAFDSAEVAPSARAQLDALAEGIKMLPAGQAVVVEGHTDATGSDEYNLRLSQRRAQAVKQYLVRMHGIDEQRLLDTGRGETQPIEGADPHASANRRVQFRGA
jgi:outer membrane protein OmpA-like peptidoglycan-associated protein